MQGRDPTPANVCCGQQFKASEDKTKEFVIMASRMWVPPPPRPDVERVSRLRVLGVIMNDRLTAADHVTMLLWSSSSLMYAMRVLWVHSVLTASVHDIFRATVVSRIQYTSPAWSAEMCSAADRARLDSLLLSDKRLGYCADDMPTVADLFNTSDYDFFHRVKTNSNHFLHPYLPDQTDIPYQLWFHSHNMSIINRHDVNFRPISVLVITTLNSLSQSSTIMYHEVYSRPICHWHIRFLWMIV